MNLTFTVVYVRCTTVLNAGRDASRPYTRNAHEKIGLWKP